MKGRTVTMDAYAFALSRPIRTTSNNTQGAAMPCRGGARRRLPLQGVPSLRARCVPVILISIRALPNPYSFPKTSPLPLICHPDIA